MKRKPYCTRWNSQRRTVVRVYSTVLSVRLDKTELGSASQMPRMEASCIIFCFCGKQWSMHISSLLVHNKASLLKYLKHCKSTFKMNTFSYLMFFCRKECHSYILNLIFNVRQRALILLLSVPSIVRTGNSSKCICNSTVWRWVHFMNQTKLDGSALGVSAWRKTVP